MARSRETEPIPGVGASLREIVIAMLPAVAVWLAIVVLSRVGGFGQTFATKWGGTGTGGVPIVIILSSAGLVTMAAWKIVRARRRMRDRREAIKAKRAGLCTCNYPRPPGILKCPECGGDMVMR